MTVVIRAKIELSIIPPTTADRSGALCRPYSAMTAFRVVKPPSDPEITLCARLGTPSVARKAATSSSVRHVVTIPPAKVIASCASICAVLNRSVNRSAREG